MTATIIDGKAVAEAIRNEVKAEVAQLRAKGLTPGLATVIVGARPDSVSYVTSKRKTCEELGIRSIGVEFPEDVSQDELLARVRQLSSDPQVHGILVQLPLPKHINEEVILNAVDIDKDVDGFHPVNVGKLGMKGREPLFAPCTPLGVIELLDRVGAKISGSRAVVLGRSNIVGLPVALLLLGRDATVTICHSKTQNLAEACRQADILVAAIGKPRFVTADMVKPGAFVIDVGVNSLPVLNPDGSPVISDKTGKPRTKLVGDVDFDAVKEIATAITPVPGGVGPMTIAMLMKSTLRGAKHAFGLL
jgi:methylenetetrahydrofolate dehydrogenase (NADP+) / methenyltetrahydrofolate cyclohydrolase